MCVCGRVINKGGDPSSTVDRESPRKTQTQKTRLEKVLSKVPVEYDTRVYLVPGTV